MPAKAGGDTLGLPGEAQTAQQPQPADVQVGYVEVTVHTRQFQVVDAHHAHAIGVDDLFVQHVAGEV